MDGLVRPFGFSVIKKAVTDLALKKDKLVAFNK